jgi:hypothetical protein
VVGKMVVRVGKEWECFYTTLVCSYRTREHNPFHNFNPGYPKNRVSQISF